MVLYINSCLRKESRTALIANAYLQHLGKSFTEINLNNENIPMLNSTRIEKRDDLIAKRDFTDHIFDYAKQFANADFVVISAPYWDNSIPSILKNYIENISVSGITFTYTEEGLPYGLCKAEKFVFITTSGGPYLSDYAFNYLNDLFTSYGIKNTELIYAENLDLIDSDPDKIIRDVINQIKQ